MTDSYVVSIDQGTTSTRCIVFDRRGNLVSVAQTEMLRDALESKGVRVETELYPDTGHAATVAGFSRPARGSAPTLDQAVSFLDSLTSTSTARIGPLQ